MLRRVLIANRGEIAVRIVRACHELGIEAVQAVSEADQGSLAAQLADRVVCIGPAAASASYLDPTLLVSAAVAHGCDAVHPGYGFLSEKSAFAELCVRHGVAFVGPDATAIAQMGDKATARRIAKSVGVPTVPGSGTTLASADEAVAVAADIGFPVLLKATAGGGGRGMRVVREPGELATAFAEAQREAQAAFGDGRLYLEKFLPEVRHVEIQVLSDGSTCLHLGERDCSSQRRNQKLVEEGPSPVLDEDLRRTIGEAAVRLARKVCYRSAGTVEFIVDPATRSYWFMEMNTRIQVEHPVTEMLTGVDLVKAQLRIAGGEPIGLAQDDVVLTGHAIECRVNAEDPDAGFMPSPGLLTQVRLPGGAGVRVDSHVYAGYTVPPFYDSLIAKVICWGRDRPEAIARMQRALGEMKVEGVATTIGFHRRLLAAPAFVRGEVHTRWVQDVFLAKRQAQP